jgi:hypothetical protein
VTHTQEYDRPQPDCGETIPRIVDTDIPILVSDFGFGFFVEQHQTPVARAAAIVVIFLAVQTAETTKTPLRSTRLQP